MLMRIKVYKTKKTKPPTFYPIYFCDVDNQRVNDVSKMKNSSSALQQATGPVGHKTQDQATQTTCEIPRPPKPSRDSADFLKNEVLRIPFEHHHPTPQKKNKNSYNQ